MLQNRINKLTRIGVFYDGVYFWKVGTYYSFIHERRSRLSISGLHNFIVNRIARYEDSDQSLCKIVEAHYFRGRISAKDIGKDKKHLYKERIYEDALYAEGVHTHYFPVWIDENGQKHEKGVDVSFALEAYDAALRNHLDVVVLIACDGDYAPLVRKLNAAGVRVMLLAWDFFYQSEKGDKISTTTSLELIQEVSYPMMMHEIIDSRSNRNDPYVDGLFSLSTPRSAAPAGLDKLLEEDDTYEDDQSIEEQALTVDIQEGDVEREADDQAQDTETNIDETEEVQQISVDPLEVDPEREAENAKFHNFYDVKESLPPPPSVKVLGRIDLPDRPDFYEHNIRTGDDDLDLSDFDGQLPPEVKLGFAEGTIKLLRQGWGFIDVGSSKEDAFFYHTSLVDCTFEELRPHDLVEMTLERNKEGKLIAKDIMVL